MADTTASPNTAASEPRDSLEPLTADRHGHWRLSRGDFAHAGETPFIPLLLAEFAAAARIYPVVFSASDPSPMALLGLERSNLFVSEGAWDLGQIATTDQSAGQPGEAYIPAYIRRHPFAFLRAQDDRHVLAIDPASPMLLKEGGEGEPLFNGSDPSPITQAALAFCEAFRIQADTTIDFVKALDARGLLVERQANLVLNNGRNLGLTGFRIVDETRFATLDGPTIVEWHVKGWLGPIHFHLASLDRFHALARRQALRDEITTSADPAKPGSEPSIYRPEPVS